MVIDVLVSIESDHHSCKDATQHRVAVSLCCSLVSMASC